MNDAYKSEVIEFIKDVEHVPYQRKIITTSFYFCHLIKNDSLRINVKHKLIGCRFIINYILSVGEFR